MLEQDVRMGLEIIAGSAAAGLSVKGKTDTQTQQMINKEKEKMRSDWILGNLRAPR